MARYLATKTYNPERGLSCTFRQWRAQSHCRFLHGYALGVTLVFACDQLDDKHWVTDFGGLKWVKDYLEYQFDHTTCIAADDPEMATFQTLANQNLIQLRVVPVTSCEGFAKLIYDFVSPRIMTESIGRVVLHSVTVFEHAANSATYSAD